jgi:hypothetical protein
MTILAPLPPKSGEVNPDLPPSPKSGGVNSDLPPPNLGDQGGNCVSAMYSFCRGNPIFPTFAHPTKTTKSLFTIILFKIL